MEQQPKTFGEGKLTSEEHEAIEKALQKRLGPNYMRERPGAGGQKIQYIEGWRLIDTANKIFGFNGWSHSITDSKIDFLDHSNGKFYVGVTAFVKVLYKVVSQITLSNKRLFNRLLSAMEPLMKILDMAYAKE